MNILGSFMVPHPPLIIPEVGRENEEQIRKTIDSYNNVANQIAKLNPETIIISSPHTLLFESCFYVSKKDRMKGSFERFNAPQVEFDEEIDLDLVNEIYRLGEKKGFPIYDFEGDDTVELDHGTMVPLYFIKKKLPKTKIVVVGLSRLPLITNYQFGMLIKEAIDNTNKKVVFVASGDLSHKLQEYGPYGFVKEGPVYDERIMNTMSSANFNELLEYDEDFLFKLLLKLILLKLMLLKLLLKIILLFKLLLFKLLLFKLLFEFSYAKLMFSFFSKLLKRFSRFEIFSSILNLNPSIFNWASVLVSFPSLSKALLLKQLSSISFILIFKFVISSSKSFKFWELFKRSSIFAFLLVKASILLSTSSTNFLKPLVS